MSTITEVLSAVFASLNQSSYLLHEAEDQESDRSWELQYRQKKKEDKDAKSITSTHVKHQDIVLIQMMRLACFFTTYSMHGELQTLR